MSTDGASAALESFIDWFKINGGYLDITAVGFKNFPDSEGGRGMVAIQHIPEEHVLFSIPRHLALSTRNSLLPSQFGLNEWKRLQLDKGWAGLILCMMWEQAKGPSSKWSEYLAVLPDKFDTPMLWDNEDLQELQGTSVVEKLGKGEANEEYKTKIVPAIQGRPDLFPSDTWSSAYSLSMYHIMGSRILSRSFHVERWHADSGDSEANDLLGDTSDSIHDVPMDSPENEESDDDVEGENPSDVAMVPMADMLNARYGSENAKLFYEQTCLKMVSTRSIHEGEQVWNTYGDLPNAELLRRYGHVDTLPLSRGGVGNPGDVVEIRADIVADVLLKRDSTVSLQELKERIDWWLDEGGDDVIVIEAEHEVPPLLLSLIRLFLLSKSEWEGTRRKSKPPRAKMEADVLVILIATLHQRLKAYQTNIEEDEKLLQSNIGLNKRHAVIVRLGEKRILTNMLDTVQNIGIAQGGGTNKRKRLADEI
ncbi:hypothetical protein AX17_005802 [Amanita inopinata Kibby_2008]|nr:hypothetical protein AX17_005802 [Amanita inopinata Kibby_2008]